MEFVEFINKVESVKKSTPILFELDSDRMASELDLDKIEMYYGIKFPESYKMFLKKYGGGYFAYTVVYSCDSNSNFYILERVAKDWVEKNNFFPVIDFETGDLAGFRVRDKVCENRISVFDHDVGDIVVCKECDFFEALVLYGLKSWFFTPKVNS